VSSSRKISGCMGFGSLAKYTSQDLPEELLIMFVAEMVSNNN